MAEGLHPIQPLSAPNLERGPISGEPGELVDLPISALRIDDSFQRALSAGSVRNIRRIIAGFDWAKFLPVIVVKEGEPFDMASGRACGDEIYSIVDGQHRTIAALTLGLSRVPCYVLACSPMEAAGAFAAINGNVTPVTPVDLWFAELRAGVPEVQDLKRILDACNVRITRKKDGLEPGDTRSINVIRRARKVFGDDTLHTILQCITECGTGNPGTIIGSVVNGIGNAIKTKTDLLREPTILFEIFDKIDIAEEVRLAKIETAESGNPVQFVLTRRFNSYIAAPGTRRPRRA